jgi:hypothetical protein
MAKELRESVVCIGSRARARGAGSGQGRRFYGCMQKKFRSDRLGLGLAWLLLRREIGDWSRFEAQSMFLGRRSTRLEFFFCL